MNIYVKIFGLNFFVETFFAMKVNFFIEWPIHIVLLLKSGGTLPEESEGPCPNLSNVTLNILLIKFRQIG